MVPMNSKKQKKLIRLLQRTRGCSYTEALDELRGLGPDVAWEPYIKRVNQQLVVKPEGAP